MGHFHILQPNDEKFTSLFKNANIQITFRTNSTIYDKLNTNIYEQWHLPITEPHLSPLLYRSNWLASRTEIQRTYQVYNLQ